MGPLPAEAFTELGTTITPALAKLAKLLEIEPDSRPSEK